MRRVCEAIPDHIKKFGDAYHVLHGALSTSQDKKVLSVMKEHYKQMETFFGKIVAEGQKSGAFNKSMSPQSAAWQFIMTGVGYAMISLNLGIIDRAMVRETIEAILRGLKN